MALLAEQTAGMARTDPPSDCVRTETLGLAEVALTILRGRQALRGAVAAVVDREAHSDGFRVRISLLGSTPDADRAQPSEGLVIAAYIVRILGSDLAEAFGGEDTIVLK